MTTDLDNKITDYFNLHFDIHDAFGYQDDGVIPLADARSCWWMIIGHDSAGEVVFGDDEPFSECFEDGTCRSGYILEHSICRTQSHVMIMIELHDNGKKQRIIFRADKEIVDKAIINKVSEDFGWTGGG
jgi:hypothetical protein